MNAIVWSPRFSCVTLAKRATYSSQTHALRGNTICETSSQRLTDIRKLSVNFDQPSQYRPKRDRQLDSELLALQNPQEQQVEDVASVGREPRAGTVSKTVEYKTDPRVKKFRLNRGVHALLPFRYRVTKDPVRYYQSPDRPDAREQSPGFYWSIIRKHYGSSPGSDDVTGARQWSAQFEQHAIKAEVSYVEHQEKDDESRGHSARYEDDSSMAMYIPPSAASENHTTNLGLPGRAFTKGCSRPDENRDGMVSSPAESDTHVAGEGLLDSRTPMKNCRNTAEVRESQLLIEKIFARPAAGTPTTDAHRRWQARRTSNSLTKSTSILGNASSRPSRRRAGRQDNGPL
ncbi:hypothetical protein NA57DRAFT_74366 [Rhizodiscina lignyota]|uniref:Uncharacterized protein n=1 Tax=Rhizodiscina lignyota TaxID=1504668 RepID=A0A9P4M7R7_9PEZI|nr:hypothetical protein NA57DRAFT_74366 [Rhizodiscina lignyota]